MVSMGIVAAAQSRKAGFMVGCVPDLYNLAHTPKGWWCSKDSTTVSTVMRIGFEKFCRAAGPMAARLRNLSNI